MGVHVNGDNNGKINNGTGSVYVGGDNNGTINNRGSGGVHNEHIFMIKKNGTAQCDINKYYIIEQPPLLLLMVPLLSPSTVTSPG
uniref:Uncharacterized protein n=1 Tax=Panagrolaimus sp. ES5 TaxID=591445 RepID=A0AC34GW08_9BILA